MKQQYEMRSTFHTLDKRFVDIVEDGGQMSKSRNDQMLAMKTTGSVEHFMESDSLINLNVHPRVESFNRTYLKSQNK